MLWHIPRALQHESPIRADLMAKVQATAHGGVALAEMHAMVDEMETPAG
jgi:hypothetical protein